MRRVRPVFRAITVMLLTAATALASPTPPVLKLAGNPPSYQEQYRASNLGPAAVGPVTIARSVVGVHRGYGSGKLDLQAIQINFPTSAAATNYCIRIATTDDRYAALNSYTRFAGTGVGTETVETRSQYRQELAALYPATEVVIRAIASKQCAANAIGPIIPALPPGASLSGPLVIFLNFPGQLVQASMNYGADKPDTTGRCRRNVSGAVAYTHICELDQDPAQPARLAKLTVKVAPSATTLTLDVLVTP